LIIGVEEDLLIDPAGGRRMEEDRIIDEKELQSKNEYVNRHEKSF
jgi:hypothetical protein